MPTEREIAAASSSHRAPRPSPTQIGNRKLNAQTLMLGYGFDPELSEGSLKPPIFLTSTYPGSGRKVYPGFLQLAGFMTMNLGSHLVSHWEMFKHLVVGDDEGAGPTQKFYEEYRSVCDMTAEFYLQTVDVVFQQHQLPKGEMKHRGRRVDPSAIRDTALLAIEGERDDISGIGQTRAALDIATRLPEAKKQYFMARDVGHYGIFNGRKWRDKIAPVFEKFIAANDGA